MEKHRQDYFAVLTGDFIGFSDLDIDIRRQMPDIMVNGGRKLMKAFNGIMSHDVAVFRGDSWQALIDDPVRSLRAAIFLRAYVRSIGGKNLDTRMAIGVGKIDYVPSGQVSAGDGEAFRRSGKLLEKMAGPNKGRIRFAFPQNPAEALADAVVRLSASLVDSWSSRQARAILGALQGFSPARIIEVWPEPITRQAVSKHLSRAGWPAIAHALEVFEDWLIDSMK